VIGVDGIESLLDGMVSNQAGTTANLAFKGREGVLDESCSLSSVELVVAIFVIVGPQILHNTSDHSRLHVAAHGTRVGSLLVSISLIGTALSSVACKGLG